MRGLKRSLVGGFLLAFIVFFLPDGLLGALTVGSGLASLLPAAAPPLGTTARLMLALIALIIGFALTFWLVRRSRPSWDVDDSADAEPLPAFEQMVTSPGPPAVRDGASALATAAVRAPDAPQIDTRLSRLEAAVADMSTQMSKELGNRPGGADTASILARVEALEAQVGERLTAIDAKLAAPNGPVARGRARQPRAPARLGETLANIRRSLDGGA